MKASKITLFIFTISLFISWESNCQKANNITEITDVIIFNINLNDRSNDTFKVKVTAPQLTSENNIFQFASTAPGTYRILDMGRYVHSFIAMDAKGNLITTTQISTNQFKISKPEEVKTIIYEISETFDTPVIENKISAMSGSSIEDDHALINGFTVLGYFKGLQKRQINIILNYPDDWLVGTALKLNDDGTYTADSYDHAIDSPILLGNLTKASTIIEGTTIDIYTYSARGKVKSEQILTTLDGMLISASKFLNGLPVDNYVFLFFFETNSVSPKGALEHSYSSLYTNTEKPWSKITDNMKDMAAHEFFHIVIPLNIHSEIIEEFNFIEPVPSRHLWFYEGVTEWASQMMLLRSNEKSLDAYLKDLRRKSYISKYYDDAYSLLDLSLESYTDKGRKEFGNIYLKGAVVAGLLDIRLLELSNGERGLIDVINEMTKVYGPNKPFNDATFFDDFTNFTYPEIREFIDLYIKKTTALPLDEFYQKIGITHNPYIHSFELDKKATKAQKNLRNIWMKAL